MLQAVADNTLYRCHYWKETAGLYEAVVADKEFGDQIRKIVSPAKPIELFNPPADRITVAVHVRKGGSKFEPPLGSVQQYQSSKLPEKRATQKKYAEQFWPDKFPPDQYYIDQIVFLSEMLNDCPLYLYIFTDYKKPVELVSRYQKAVNKANITFACRTEHNSNDINVLEDFFSIGKFDCLIRSNSNFGWGSTAY